MACLSQTTSLQFVNRLETAIEQRHRAALGREFCAQIPGRRDVGRQVRIDDHAIGQRAVRRDEPGLHVEHDLFYLALERVTATAATPGIGQQQVAGRRP